MTKKEYSELVEILARLDERQQAILEQVNRTNVRLCSLEKWRTIMTTAGSVVASVVALQWALFKDLFNIFN